MLTDEERKLLQDAISRTQTGIDQTMPDVKAKVDVFNNVGVQIGCLMNRTPHRLVRPEALRASLLLLCSYLAHDILDSDTIENPTD